MSELKPEDKKLHKALNKAMASDDFYDTILEAAQAKQIRQLEAENEKLTTELADVYKKMADLCNNCDLMKDFGMRELPD